MNSNETHLVTYQNYVDTDELSELKITKTVSGSNTNTNFDIKVKLGDVYIPVGTKYYVGSEEREVSTEGVISIKNGETAVIGKGILAGTEYEIYELNDSGEYIPTYSGSVVKKDTSTNSGEVICTESGVTGVMPLCSTLNVQITNVKYNKYIEIPIKKVLIGDTTASFNILVQKVEYDSIKNEYTETDNYRNGTSIEEYELNSDNYYEGNSNLYISFNTNDVYVGDNYFYYKIYEEKKSSKYQYDKSYYIVEVKVSKTRSEGNRYSLIVSWTKVIKYDANGNVIDEKDSTSGYEIEFTNYQYTSAIISKVVKGGESSKKFPFEVEILLDDEKLTILNSKYETGEDGTISFELTNNESMTIDNIPFGASVTVKETEYDGFIPYYQTNTDYYTWKADDTVEVKTSGTTQVINFCNFVSYELPKTG